jgi:hypothetical protein
LQEKFVASGDFERVFLKDAERFALFTCNADFLAGLSSSDDGRLICE